MPETITATVGWSGKSDAAVAGQAAAEMALERLSSKTIKLAIVFGSSWFDQAQMLSGIRGVIGDIPLIGESTAGEILPHGASSHHCIVVLIASETLACSIGFSEQVDQHPREAGQKAAQAALRDFPGTQRIGFLLFGDGLITTYGDVVRGLQESLGTSSLIVGAMAGDDLRFERTYQYFRGQALNQSVVGVLLGRPAKIGVGSEHGFAPISKPRRITRAKANLLFELDQQPASAVYEEYFGAELVQRMHGERMSRQGIAYPLGIQYGSTNQWLLRNVIGFGRDGSLACSGEVPEGSWLQLMMGSRELAVDAAYRAAQQAMRALNRVACVLVFDSVVRRTLLGSQLAAAELARIREVVGPSVPLVGCYTYGEQAPFQSATSYEHTATQTGSILVVALGT